MLFKGNSVIMARAVLNCPVHKSCMEDVLIRVAHSIIVFDEMYIDSK